MKGLDAALANSTVVDAAKTVRRWWGHSAVGRLLSNDRLLLLALGAVLAVSLVSVLGSDMATTTKFLSFLLLFVLTAALTLWLAQRTAE